MVSFRRHTEPLQCFRSALLLANFLVVAMTDRFNFVSDWVVNILCTAENPKTRVTYFQKFLRIADELRNLGNFNGVLEIMSGIRRGPVDRLKKSFNV